METLKSFTIGDVDYQLQCCTFSAAHHSHSRYFLRIWKPNNEKLSVVYSWHDQTYNLYHVFIPGIITNGFNNVKDVKVRILEHLLYGT